MRGTAPQPGVMVQDITVSGPGGDIPVPIYTTIVAAEIDPLLSGGKTYADRLKKDGVTVSYKKYKGVTHEFFGIGAVMPKAKETEQFAADAWVKPFEAKGQ